jgi:hypothetical protein
LAAPATAKIPSLRGYGFLERLSVTNEKFYVPGFDPAFERANPGEERF